MISTAFLNTFYIFALGITFVIGKFGEVSPNNDLTSAIIVFKSYYLSLSPFIPYFAIMAIIAFDIAFEIGGVFAYKMIRWAYQKVPFIN